jgi:thiol-disulfide isomerase/thioredoxin
MFRTPGVPMRRVLFAGLVVLTGGLWAALGDEPKSAPTSPEAKKLAKIKSTLADDEKELRKKLDAAKDPDDKKQVEFLIKEKYAFAADDALEIADANKKDEVGLEAAAYAMELLGKYKITGVNMTKAADLLLDNHLDSPKIGVALAAMVDNGPPGQVFLETVLERAMNKEVQALAIYYNAVAKDNRISAAEGPGTDPDKVAKARAEVSEAMEKAARLSPDTRVGELTLAKAVEIDLAALKVNVGNPVPEVEGTDLDGKKAKLSGLKGKVVLFDFWATWCGPCRAMIPHERELVEKYKDKPFAILSVSADSEKGDLTEFLGSEKMPWTHWWDGEKGPVTKLFRVKAFPTLYLIDAKGVIRHKWVGNPGNDKIDRAVEDLVAEAKK